MSSLYATDILGASEKESPYGWRKAKCPACWMWEHQIACPTCDSQGQVLVPERRHVEGTPADRAERQAGQGRAA